MTSFVRSKTALSYARDARPAPCKLSFHIHESFHQWGLFGDDDLGESSDLVLSTQKPAMAATEAAPRRCILEAADDWPSTDTEDRSSASSDVPDESEVDYDVHMPLSRLRIEEEELTELTCQISHVFTCRRNPSVVKLSSVATHKRRATHHPERELIKLLALDHIPPSTIMRMPRPIRKHIFGQSQRAAKVEAEYQPKTSMSLALQRKRAREATPPGSRGSPLGDRASRCTALEWPHRPVGGADLALPEADRARAASSAVPVPVRPASGRSVSQ